MGNSNTFYVVIKRNSWNNVEIPEELRLNKLENPWRIKVKKYLINEK